jgi:hypothetical protein
MGSEGKIWRFWGVLAGVLGVLWAGMGLSAVRDHSPGPLGQVSFWLASYGFIAIVVCLAALFQNYEMRGGDERWERNRAILRRWTLGAFGVGAIVDAIREGSEVLNELTAGRPDFLHIFWAALLLLVGVYVVYCAIRTEPTKRSRARLRASRAAAGRPAPPTFD